MGVPLRPDEGSSAPLSTLPDLGLVAIARDAADPARGELAFRELVDRHRQRIYGLCCRILRDPEDAEDAARRPS
mgnify:CR=1 FL=1